MTGDAASPLVIQAETKWEPTSAHSVESRLVQKLNWQVLIRLEYGAPVRICRRLKERMMSDSSYKQFCPVAMASEILCSRWTLVVIRELVAGSTRFNELRRGVPRMSPALLSRNWWLIVEPGKPVDLCWTEPGFDVDLYLATDLRTMTEVWMGYMTVAKAKERGKLIVTGNRQLQTTVEAWLRLSSFAKVDELVA
jgi:hypothetical protein